MYVCALYVYKSPRRSKVGVLHTPVTIALWVAEAGGWLGLVGLTEKLKAPDSGRDSVLDQLRMTEKDT